jgi:hypothetical protein
MRPALCLCVALVVALGGAESVADYSGYSFVSHGGAAGGDALYLPNGDLLNVRNIQGGTVADGLNLDIGAGSTANPGDVVLNYDVGRRVLIYDGQKRLVASFGPDGIRFYKKVSGYETNQKSCGWWRWRRCCRHPRVLSRSGGR